MKSMILMLVGVYLSNIMAGFFWPKHRDDRLNCNCRTCYWARNSLEEEEIEGTLVVKSYEPHFLYSGQQAMYGIPAKPREMPKPLEVRIAEDIDAIIAQNGDWVGTEEIHKDGKELPEREYDLEKYEDALAYAINTCMHNEIQADDPFNPKYIHCNDCEKDMTYNQFMNDRWVRSGSSQQRRRRH